MSMLGSVRKGDTKSDEAKREGRKPATVRKLRLPRCRHRYTWVVSYAEQAAATDAVHYVKYQQCRRCGSYLQRVA